MILIITGGFQVTGSNSLVVPRTKHAKAKTETYPLKALGYIKMKADGTVTGILHSMLMPSSATFDT